MKNLDGNFIVELHGNGLVNFNLHGIPSGHLVLKGKHDEVGKNLRSVTITTIGDQDYAAFDAQLEEFLEKFEEAHEYSFQFGGTPAKEWPVLIYQYVK